MSDKSPSPAPRDEQEAELWQTVNGNTALNMGEVSRSVERSIQLLDEVVRRDDLETVEVANLFGQSRSLEVLANNFVKTIEAMLAPENEE